MSDALLVAPCTRAAARHAVESWHYSRSMPVGPLATFGVWERGAFVGAVLFGRGATPNIGKPFGLAQTEVCELVRVALAPHETPVSRVLAIAVRMLRRGSPGLRLVVSYADSKEGHHGGIYQAAGWSHIGRASTARVVVVFGETLHPKSANTRWGPSAGSLAWLRANVDPDAQAMLLPAKYKYALPLDDAMRAQIAPLALPYPKRAAEPTSVGAGDQPAQGGATPTRPLTTTPAGR